MDPVTPGHRTIAYSLPLGEAWARIRLDANAEADVKALLDAAFDGIPAEQAADARLALVGQFAAQISAARAKSGLDLFVPAGRFRAGSRSADPAAPAAVVLTAEVVIPSEVAPEPIAVIQNVAAAHPAARTGIIAGAPAVRLEPGAEAEAAGSEGAGASGETGTGTGADTNAVPTAPGNGARRIEYVVVVPGDPLHRWLSIALNVQAASGGADGSSTSSDQAVADFDAAVAALEWV